MSEINIMKSESLKNKGWLVTSAGLSINLALGILYAWSVFKESIAQSIKTGGDGAFTWNLSNLNDPYAVCILAFAFSMTIAGKIQDKKGPSFTAKIGGVLVGAGFIMASLSTNYYVWLLGFGILGGMGIGFGYSATTPASLKWFSSAKTGLIAGIVVSGFGLAPVYIAPLSSLLVASYGLQTTMLIFGISFLFFIVGLAFFLNNPPAGYVPIQSEPKINKRKKTSENTTEDFETMAMLKTPKFYIMWFIFFIGSGVGLMVISNISGLAKASMGKSAFIAVAIMAIGNASGRIIAGIISDIISKSLTLAIILIFQSSLMFISWLVLNDNSPAFIIVLFATFIGFNYGTNLSLFPSFTKGFWGMKNFGFNYGILMSAWGLGGFVFSKLSQYLYVSTGNHNLSFIIAGSSLILCLFLDLILLEIKSMN
ncbi:MAG: OFA family MFS transporter [Bacteroidales bacterium]|nr:OFA family MFS transporter [Bacteroidales bacterium]